MGLFSDFFKNALPKAAKSPHVSTHPPTRLDCGKEIVVGLDDARPPPAPAPAHIGASSTGG